MQSTQKLTKVFKDILSLVENEAMRNPAFAERLEAIVSEIGVRVGKTPRIGERKKPANQPAVDIFSARGEKGEEEFRFWLRSLDVPTLKSIVKANGFDPGKVSRRWTEPDKLIDLISEQVTARLHRGSAFLTPKKQIEAADRSPNSSDEK